MEEKKTCGLIMPISNIDGCSAEHWKDVLSIIKSALNESDFECKLVSESDDVGIIHKRIVQNIYNSDIVVCDVSAKNPNVMFELGMRLAFDKPTVIIKDDKTDYSFDTSSIEHLEYPRDLRFNKIEEFKVSLFKKVQATYSKSMTDPNYTTFLQHFGNYKIATIEEKEVSGQDYIVSAIDELKNDVQALRNSSRNIFVPPRSSRRKLDDLSNGRLKDIRSVLLKHFEVFREKESLDSINDIMMRKDDIESYLESIDEVRDVCVSPFVLSEAVDKFIINNNTYLANFL